MQFVVGISSLLVWVLGFLLIFVGLSSTDIQLGMGVMSVGIGSVGMGVSHLIHQNNKQPKS